MEEFTSEELQKKNGRNGAPAFIAYRGRIYDVSGSFHWKLGKHQVLHSAGEEVTDALAQAPHDSDVLERFPVVGVLKED